MIWLAFSILCSTLIFIIFKLFARYEVNNLQAIVVNYFVAFAAGSISNGFPLDFKTLPTEPWFLSSLILGIVFISLFQVMAFVSQKLGVSTVSISVKMSLAIPVVAAIILYDEQLYFTKVLGVIAALAAVYMASFKPEKTKGHRMYIFMPIILFVGSGLLDAFINYNQRFLVPSSQYAQFTSISFLLAGLFGVLFLIIKRINAPLQLQWKSLAGGVLLGIPNYGSIYFLLKALDVQSLESSVIFPINNVGIVALSVIIARIFFKESLSLLNKIGIALAILAIVLIAF